MTDPLSDFLAEARKRNVPDRQRRLELLREARTPDTTAKHAYIDSMLHDTAQEALRTKPDSLNALDAIQEAIVVLTRLIEDQSVDDPQTALPAAIRDHWQSLQH